MPAADYFALCAPGTNTPVEIANAPRLDAYLQNGLKPTTWLPGGSACSKDLQVRQLIQEVCQDITTPSYTTPQVDDAPWYDPLIPESAGFAGVIVKTLEGLDEAPIDREVTRKVNGGAALGSLRYTERVMEFEVTLVGSSCCSVAYGYRWLASMLQGCCGSGCDLPSMYFLEGIPNLTQQTYCAPDMPFGAITVPNESNRTPIRSVHNVGLTEGPRVVERRGTGCGCGCTPVMDVEFTLVAGNPFIFSPQQDVVLAENLLTGTGDCETDPYVWRFCEVPPDCGPDYPAYDPRCSAPVPAPAPAPPALSCFCEPLAYREKQFTFTAASPDWFELAAIVEVDNPTAEPLRNLTVRFGQTNGDCNLLTDCDWCSSLGIEYIPPYAKLIIDSERREIMLYVNDTYYNAERSVVSAAGTPFRWIDLGCGDYCVKIQSDAFNTPANATVAIRGAVKEL